MTVHVLEKPLVAPEVVQPVVDYPDSDGEPMGETGIHARATLHLYSALRFFLRHQPDTYVAADMFLYYEEGNPQTRKAPDVMVIKGIGSHERRSFMTWVEKAAPCVIFEITSRSTWLEDLVNKSSLYARMGVAEYFLFDPLEEYLEPSLQGLRLRGQEYVPISADSDGHLFSAELKVKMRREAEMLRLIDPDTEEPVPGLEEIYYAAERAKQWAEQEAQRAAQEAQRAEQEAQRAAREVQRAEREAQRAEQEAQRAEQEAQRADLAETEVARLRTLLEQRQSSTDS